MLVIEIFFVCLAVANQFKFLTRDETSQHHFRNIISKFSLFYEDTLICVFVAMNKFQLKEAVGNFDFIDIKIKKHKGMLGIEVRKKIHTF